jgi:hypothetical protein
LRDFEITITLYFIYHADLFTKNKETYNSHLFWTNRHRFFLYLLIKTLQHKKHKKMNFQSLQFMRDIASIIDPDLVVVGDNGEQNGPFVYAPPGGSGTDWIPLIPIMDGTSTGGPLDPSTGGPIDPSTGGPIDPSTGGPLDPSTGGPLDPSTGGPLDPSTGGTDTEPVIGGNKCNWGPSYWCENEANFQECVKSKQPDATLETFPVCNKSQNKCIQGPAYWCASDKNFAECIQSKGYDGTRDSFKACQVEPTKPIGGKKCTWGPAYWCASDSNFKECIQSKGYDGTRQDFKACAPYMNTDVCAKDLKNCSDGSTVTRDPENECQFKPCPTRVCAMDVKSCDDGSTVPRDPANNCRFMPCPTGVCPMDVKSCDDGSTVPRDPANECQFMPCPTDVCPMDVKICPDGSTMPRDQENSCQFMPCPVGSKDCTKGPAFWCASDENFKKCVQSKGYNGDRTSLAACKPYLTKPTKCTQGPAYWCSSDKRFKECNNLLGATRKNTKACKPYMPTPVKPIPGLGEHKCTQGPAYWCASKENYEKCVESTKSYEDFCAQYTPDDGHSDNTFIICPHCGEKVKNQPNVENYLGHNQNIYQFRNYQVNQ